MFSSNRKLTQLPKETSCSRIKNISGQIVEIENNEYKNHSIDSSETDLT